MEADNPTADVDTLLLKRFEDLKKNLFYEDKKGEEL